MALCYESEAHQGAVSRGRCSGSPRRIAAEPLALVSRHHILWRGLSEHWDSAGSCASGPPCAANISCASKRMMFPCLSRQCSFPTNTRPSATSMRVRRCSCCGHSGNGAARAACPNHSLPHHPPHHQQVLLIHHLSVAPLQRLHHCQRALAVLSYF